MKVVIYSNLHGVGPAIQKLVEENSLDASAWSVTDAVQLQELLSEVTPSVVLVGERGLFEYLHTESEVFGSELPPYRRMVISYVSPASTELWGAELGFDGMIDGAENAHVMLEKLNAVNAGESLLKNNPAYQPPIAFNPQLRNAVKYQDGIDEQIVLMIAAGLDDREISERVFISMQELRKRIHRLVATANIHNRTQLAVMYSRGLCEYESGQSVHEKS